MKLIRDLVREEIAKILNDDVLAQTRMSPSDYPGLVDDDDEKEHNHNKKSYMARPQLSRISKYSTELLNMIKDGEEVDDWIEKMIDAVYGKYEFKNSSNY